MSWRKLLTRDLVRCLNTGGAELAHSGFLFSWGRKWGGRRDREEGKKRGKQSQEGLLSSMLVQLNQGEKWGVVQAPFFFSPLNWVFVVIFNWTLQKPNCCVSLHSVYFCCTIKTASHLHLLDYTEISDYWTGRKSSNCKVSSCSFLFFFFFLSLPPKEWAENFRGKRKRKNLLNIFLFFPVEGFFF